MKKRVIVISILVLFIISGIEQFFVLAVNEPPELTNIKSTPEIPKGGLPFSISVDVLDDEKNVQNVELNYWVNEEAHNKRFKHTIGDTWEVDIGSLPAGTNLSYQIEASDGSNTVNSAKMFFILYDGIEPTIQDVFTSPENPIDNQVTTVIAKVVDNVGVESVYLRYRLNDKNETEVEMTKNGDSYTSYIPIQTMGTKIEYSVIAYDEQNNQASSEPVIAYCTDGLHPVIYEPREIANENIIYNYESFQVLAEIYDESGINQAKIDYWINGEYKGNKEMEWVSGDTYSALFEGIPGGYNFSYQITAEDNSGYTTLSHLEWFVAIDTENPIIYSVERLDEYPINTQSTTIEVNATDSSGIAYSILYWMKENNASSLIGYMMMKKNNSLWESYIPPQETDSSIVYWVEVTDKKGNTAQSENYTFTVRDGSKPYVQQHSFLNDSITKDDFITIYANVTEDESLSLVNVEIGYLAENETFIVNNSYAMSFEFKVNNTFCYSVVIPPIGDCAINVYYRFMVEDNNNNTFITDVFSFYVLDTIAPEIYSVSIEGDPRTSAVVPSDQVILKLNVSDNGELWYVKIVYSEYKGTLVYHDLFDSAYDGLKKGENEIIVPFFYAGLNHHAWFNVTVTVYDKSNNFNNTKLSFYIRDGIKPSYSNLEHSPSNVMQGDMVTFSCSYEDSSHVTGKLIIFVNYIEYGNFSMENNEFTHILSASFLVNWSIDSVITYRIYIEDSAGNGITTLEKGFRIGDGSPPTIFIEAQNYHNIIFSSSNPVTIQCKVKDNSNIIDEVTIIYQINGGEQQIDQMQIAYSEDEWDVYEYIFSSLTEGLSISFTVNATDINGNFAYSQQITFFTEDTEKPIIELLSSPSFIHVGKDNNDSFYSFFEIRVTDNVGLKKVYLNYSINSEQEETKVNYYSVTDHVYKFRLNGSDLFSLNDYVFFYFTAVDTSGNIQQTEELWKQVKDIYGPVYASIDDFELASNSHSTIWVRNVYDWGSMYVNKVILQYQIISSPNGTINPDWVNISAVKSGNDWYAELPLFEATSLVRFRITMEDGYWNERVGESFTKTVTDGRAPEVISYSIPAESSTEEEIEIVVFTYDDTGMQNATLIWEGVGGVNLSCIMNTTDGERFNVFVNGKQFDPMIQAKIWVSLTDVTGNSKIYYLNSIYVKDYVSPEITDIQYSNTVDVTETTSIRVYGYDNYKLHEFNLKVISKTYNTTYFYTIPAGDESRTYNHIFYLSPFVNDYNSHVHFIVTIKDLSSYSNDTVSNEYDIYVTDTISPIIDLQKIDWESSLPSQGDTQTIDFRLTDNYQISSAKVTVTFPDLTSLDYIASKLNGTLTDGFWRVSFIASFAGVYSFTILANDKADNVDVADNGGEEYVFLVADTTPPNFQSITIPANYSLSQDDSATIAFQISDNVVSFDLLVYKYRYKLSPSSAWSDWSQWRNVNPSTGEGSFTIPALGYTKVTENIQFQIMLSDGGDQGNIQIFTHVFTDQEYYFDILILDSFAPIVYDNMFSPYGFSLSGWANNNPITTTETGQNFEKDHDVVVTFALYDNNPVSTKGIDLSTVKLHISDGTSSAELDYDVYRTNTNPQGWESPVYEFDFTVLKTFSSKMPATIEFYIICSDQSSNQLISNTYSFIFTDTIAPQITILNGQTYDPLYTPEDYRTAPYINQNEWLVSGDIVTLYANLEDNLPVESLSTTVKFYYYNEFTGPFINIAPAETSLVYNSTEGCWIAPFDTTNYFGRMKYTVTVVDQNNNIVEVENEFYVVETESPTIVSNYPTISSTKMDDNNHLSVTVQFSDNYLACPIEYPSIDSTERAKLYVTDTMSANIGTDLEIKLSTSNIIWKNKPQTIEYRFKIYYDCELLNGISDRWTISSTPKTLYFYFAVKDEVFKDPVIFTDWTNFKFTLEDISSPIIDYVKYSSDGGSTWINIAENSLTDYYLEDWSVNGLKFKISVSDNVLLDGSSGVSVHFASVRFAGEEFTSVETFSNVDIFTYTLDWTYDIRSFGADTGAGEYHPLTVTIRDLTGRETSFDCSFRLIDQTAPSISNIQYESYPQRGEEQIIKATVIDHHINELLYDSAYVRMYWGLQPGPYDSNYIDMVYNDVSGFWECPFTLNDTDVKFFIKAKDRSGNIVVENNNNAYYALGGTDNNPPTVLSVSTSNLANLEENDIISVTITFEEWGGEPEYVRLFYKTEWETVYSYVSMTLDSQNIQIFTYSGSFTCKANSMEWYIEIKDYDASPHIVTVSNGYNADWTASVEDILDPIYNEPSYLGTIYLSSVERFQIYVEDNGGVNKVELYFDFDNGYGTDYYNQYVGLCSGDDIHEGYWYMDVKIEDRDDGNLLYIREGGSLRYFFKIYDLAGHVIESSKSSYHDHLRDATPFVSLSYSVESTIYNTNPISVNVHATLDRIASNQVNLKLEYWHRPYTTSSYNYEGYQTISNDYDHTFSVNIVSLTYIHDGYIRFKATYYTDNGYSTTLSYHPTSYDTRWKDTVRPVAGSIYVSDSTPEVGDSVRIYGYNYYDSTSPTNVVRLYWRKKGSSDSWSYISCSEFGTDDYQGYITAPSYDVEAFIRIYAYQSSNNYKDSSIIYIYPYEDNAPTIGSSYERYDPATTYQSNPVYAYVSDDIGLSWVKLYYRKNYRPTTSSYTGIVTMSHVSGTKYKGTIPGFSSSCTVYWAVRARDTGGHTCFKSSSSWKYTVSGGFFSFDLSENKNSVVNNKSQKVDYEHRIATNVSISGSHEFYYLKNRYYLHLCFETLNFIFPSLQNMFIFLQSHDDNSEFILPISNIDGNNLSSALSLSSSHLKEKHYSYDLVFIDKRFNISITSFFGLEKSSVEIINIDKSPPVIETIEIMNVDSSLDILEIKVDDDVGIDYVKVYTSSDESHNDTQWNYLNLGDKGIYWTYIDKLYTKWLRIEVKDVSIVTHIVKTDWSKYSPTQSNLGLILGTSISVFLFSALGSVILFNQRFRTYLTSFSKKIFSKIKVMKK